MLIGQIATKTCMMQEEAAQNVACSNWTVKSQFCLNTQYLLCYCQVYTIDELPQIWTEVA